MIEAFFKIRIKQLSRGLVGIGLFQIIFLLGLLGLLGVFIFVQTSISPNAYYVAGITVMLISFIQTKRPDKLFLKIHFENYRLLHFIEYSIMALPIIIACLINHQWIPIVAVLLGIYLVIRFNIKPKQSNRNTILQQLIPFDSFEWKSGIRKTLLIIVPVWIIGLGSSFFIGSVPISLFIIGIIALSFYEKGEPYQMIMAFEKGPAGFMIHKIKMQVFLFTIVVSPLIAAYLIFHQKQWYIPIAEYLIFISLYAYIIATKYAYYTPNTKSSVAQFYSSIGVLAGMIPVFLPLIWLGTLHFYIKAKENLNNYLDDYN